MGLSIQTPLLLFLFQISKCGSYKSLRYAILQRLVEFDIWAGFASNISGQLKAILKKNVLRDPLKDVRLFWSLPKD